MFLPFWFGGLIKRKQDRVSQEFVKKPFFCSVFWDDGWGLFLLLIFSGIRRLNLLFSGNFILLLESGLFFFFWFVFSCFNDIFYLFFLYWWNSCLLQMGNILIPIVLRLVVVAIGFLIREFWILWGLQRSYNRKRLILSFVVILVFVGQLLIWLLNI